MEQNFYSSEELLTKVLLFSFFYYLAFIAEVIFMIAGDIFLFYLSQL